MNHRFGADLLRAVFGVLVALSLVLLLIDGVEESRRLLAGELSLTYWLARVASRWPGHLGAALPVAATIGTSLVALSWQRSGRLVAVRLCAISPARLAALAGLAAALSAGVTLTAREALAYALAEVRVGEGAWVAVEAHVPGVNGGRTVLRAHTRTGPAASGIRLAWLGDNGLIGKGWIDAARWDGERWHLQGTLGERWDANGHAWRVEPQLPTPADWALAAASSDADAPWISHWWAPPSPARTTWLGERVATWMGAICLSTLAMGATIIAPKTGFFWSVAVAVTWRLLQAGALAAAARGFWPPSLALALPVAAVAMLALVALIRVHRYP